MTSKQRAQLRSMAMTMAPTAQVGKSGITDTLIKQIDDQLEAREMIKVSVLQNSELDAKAVANDIAEATSSEVVQVLGFKITLYRVSKKENFKHII